MEQHVDFDIQERMVQDLKGLQIKKGRMPESSGAYFKILPGAGSDLGDHSC